MLEQAKAKLTAEMDGNKNNPYVQVVGGFLLQHLETDPGVAKKIMVADKTIAKSLEAMRSEAQKKKVGNMAVLTDAEGFGIVLKYFGIEGATQAPAKPIQTPVVAPAQSSDFNINLDDLL